MTLTIIHYYYYRTVLYYFEKISKNDTSVLRTASKETPDLDQQKMQQELTQNNPHYPILKTKQQGFGETL